MKLKEPLDNIENTALRSTTYLMLRKCEDRSIDRKIVLMGAPERMLTKRVLRRRVSRVVLNSVVRGDQWKIGVEKAGPKLLSCDAYPRGLRTNIE